MIVYDERKVNVMSEQNIAGNTEIITVDEENKDLDSMMDRLKRNLKTSKITCLVLGVLILVVLVARLFV
jgi:hypothetical protein